MTSDGHGRREGPHPKKYLGAIKIIYILYDPKYSLHLFFYYGPLNEIFSSATAHDFVINAKSSEI